MSQPLGASRELHCDDCDRDYEVWAADNALWNAVIRTERHEAGEPFLCSACFGVRASKAGVLKCVWVTNAELPQAPIGWVMVELP